MAAKNTNKLSVNQLRRVCNPKDLNFTSTEKLPILEGVIGQDRALKAVNFGLEIKSHGYHIYALGPTGTGKSTIVRKMLAKAAKDKPAPDDWLYINNFDDHDKPYTLKLPAGKGHKFRDDIDSLVEELKTDIPKAFESKEYEKEQEKIEQEFQKRSKELFQELEKKVSDKGFVLLQTIHGVMPMPMVEDKVLTTDQYSALSEIEKQKYEVIQEELQKKIRETVRLVEELQKKGKYRVRELDHRIVGYTVDHLINDLLNKYAKFQGAVNYLKATKESLLKNVISFKQMKQPEQNPNLSLFGASQEPTFDEYRVNLLIDNSKTKGIPVIFESNPIGPNLIGRIEQKGWFGTLVTNFRMIKAGSLHRANGGYLIIEALELLQKPFAYQLLKRCLKTREIVIESMNEVFGAFITRTLEPTPIPLDIKIILIGDPYIYYLLHDLDHEFKELFKVVADFEEQSDWNSNNVKQYAQFIGNICREEKLKHFDASAVAKVVEYCSRQVEHQEKLATNFGNVVDLVRQSNFWAHQNKSKLVRKSDVVKALEEKIYRSNRIEKHIQEMIEEGTIMVSTKGFAVGQINGLSVLKLGEYSFGKPSRITARTYIGNNGVVSIDREVKLGGPIHNKGSLILVGYLGGKYALNAPLSFSASITFEQLYEGVEGDSASSAEIYALLSSLSGCPIRQELAVTGSVNQHGDVQPIGGVNEKIEGFFQVCKIKGLTGKQGVIIPASNVPHLMLHDYVIDAVKTNKFHIYAVSTIDEGIELLTGIKAGVHNKHGHYPVNTINGAVQKRVIELGKLAKNFDKEIHGKRGKEEKKAKSKTKKKT
jgi:lon-related putative ATP-dependent protease